MSSSSNQFSPIEAGGSAFVDPLLPHLDLATIGNFAQASRLCHSLLNRTTLGWDILIERYIGISREVLESFLADFKKNGSTPSCSLSEMFKVLYLFKTHPFFEAHSKNYLLHPDQHSLLLACCIDDAEFAKKRLPADEDSLWLMPALLSNNKKLIKFLLTRLFKKLPDGNYISYREIIDTSGNLFALRHLRQHYNYHPGHLVLFSAIKTGNLPVLEYLYRHRTAFGLVFHHGDLEQFATLSGNIAAFQFLKPIMDRNRTLPDVRVTAFMSTAARKGHFSLMQLLAESYGNNMIHPQVLGCALQSGDKKLISYLLDRMPMSPAVLGQIIAYGDLPLIKEKFKGVALTPKFLNWAIVGDNLDAFVYLLQYTPISIEDYEQFFKKALRHGSIKIISHLMYGLNIPSEEKDYVLLGCRFHPGINSLLRLLANREPYATWEKLANQRFLKILVENQPGFTFIDALTADNIEPFTDLILDLEIDTFENASFYQKLLLQIAYVGDIALFKKVMEARPDFTLTPNEMTLAYAASGNNVDVVRFILDPENKFNVGLGRPITCNPLISALLACEALVSEVRKNSTDQNAINFVFNASQIQFRALPRWFFKLLVNFTVHATPETMASCDSWLKQVKGLNFKKDLTPLEYNSIVNCLQNGLVQLEKQKRHAHIKLLQDIMTSFKQTNELDENLNPKFIC